MISFFRPILLAASLAAALGIAAGPTAAQGLDLDDARSQGLVGETARGYVAPVKAATPAVTALVNKVNAARRAEYEKVARQNGTQLSDVEVLAARKILDRVPSGTYVQGSGGWARK